MDKEKLRSWALIAEVVSGIAVVATLIFLAFEMRDNTNASQAQTYQLLMEQLNEYRARLSDPTISEISVKLRTSGWDSLNVVEKRRWRTLALINWGIYESAYFANKRGILGESEWTRFEAAICRRYDNSEYIWAPEGYTPMDELLTDEFAEYAEDLCR